MENKTVQGNYFNTDSKNLNKILNNISLFKIPKNHTSKEDDLKNLTIDVLLELKQKDNGNI